MKIGRQLVSLLLLFLFGVNILAEAASFHSEQLGDRSVQTSVSQMDGSQAVLHSATDCAEGKHATTGHCADPCHTGRCHFGHCSYHSVKNYSGLDPHLALMGYLTYDLHIPNGPFLEGPKRPPRHS